MAKYDVFISYSRKDSEFAEKVCAVFDAYKDFYEFEYFFDNKEIKIANEHLERISDAISECSTMLFLASKNSYSSRFCSKELLFANEYNVTIYRYCLDNSQPPKKIKFFLIDQHFLEASTCPIEKMVRQVLSEALKQDIRPLAELEDTPPPPKPKNRWKNIVRGVSLGVLLFLAVFGLYKGYHLLTRNMQTSAPYKVGDYYNENGKKGVVFEVSADGRSGKIVSMTQSAVGKQWSSDVSEQKRLIGADSKTDGAYNMAKVKDIEGWQHKYPAFKWCADLGDDWYLPSIEELKKFTLDDATNVTVNRTLAAKGGIKLYNQGEVKSYWSSTEDDYRFPSGEFCAWFVFMRNGYTGGSYKGNDFYVRAVSAF